jgi:hypothetical protein
MNKEIQAKFWDLTCRLSPENLNCDGEISRAEANRRYKHLMKEWHALEAQVGRKVTEYEIIGNHYARTY